MKRPTCVGLALLWSVAAVCCAHGGRPGIAHSTCGESRFVVGTNQYDIIKTHPPGPVAFGEVTLTSRSNQAELPELSLLALHTPFDAPKIDWLYRASDGSPRWVVVAFENHKVVAAACAGWNGKR